MTRGRVIIYTQQSCEQSDKLKRFLVSKSIKFIEEDITYDSLRKRAMVERTGGKKVTPQIFIDGKHIGFDELKADWEKHLSFNEV